MTAQLATMLTKLKTEYLDVRKVGIRRFSTMTHITRPRLLQLFSGEVELTQEEHVRINDAINVIEERFQVIKARKPPAPETDSTIDYIADRRLLQFL